VVSGLVATSRFQVTKDVLMLEAHKVTRSENVGKTKLRCLRIFFFNFPKMKFREKPLPWTGHATAGGGEANLEDNISEINEANKGEGAERSRLCLPL